jgi:hypothetical protein
MNRMVYNPATGIYEQACEFPDMYNSNMISRNTYNEDGGNTCIGGNAAFMPGYKGINVSEYKHSNNIAVRNQIKEQNSRQTFAQQERERYSQKQENTNRLCKIAEQNYKNSPQCAYLKEEIKAEKMLANMRKK